MIKHVISAGFKLEKSIAALNSELKSNNIQVLLLQENQNILF